MKRNITMRTLLCGPNGAMLAGHSYKVDGKQAKSLVEGGYATYDNGEQIRTASAPETTSVEQDETADLFPEETAVVKSEEEAGLQEQAEAVTEPIPEKKAKPKKRRKRRKKKS